MFTARLARSSMIIWTILIYFPAETRFVMPPGLYEKHRKELIQEEMTAMLGGNIQLTEKEELANNILMMAKYKEVDSGFADESKFNPASHFFLRKANIEKSSVFKIIRMMPKGAALHVHDTSMIGTDYLLNNITYRDNLYLCDEGDEWKLIFSAATPTTDSCGWKLLKDVRASHPNVTEFDAGLGKRMTLFVDDPIATYKNNYQAWDKFIKLFQFITPMLTYRPVWEDYHYEALRQYREDNIFYVEIRSTFPTLYDLDGKTYGPVERARIYKTVNDKFVADYPDTFGSRLIYAPARFVKIQTVTEYIKILKELKRELGDSVAGFDLVGQEDTGKPLKEFIHELSAIPSSINVFYHAGETNWFGTTTDYNLFDAVLLGAKRLGHAYALTKHPLISEVVKNEGIAVEVNPISNQVLMLVGDIRNHPASVMISQNFPLVVSSDDPGLWGALPLSHDLYEMFVGMASRHSDLRLLKQLAYNSIEFSSMKKIEKAEAFYRFDNLWDKFINNIIKYPEAVKS